MKEGTFETQNCIVKGLFYTMLSRPEARMQQGRVCKGLLLAVAVLSRFDTASSSTVRLVNAPASFASGPGLCEACSIAPAAVKQPMSQLEVEKLGLWRISHVCTEALVPCMGPGPDAKRVA